MIHIQPVGDKVLVFPLPKVEEKLDSGIIQAASVNAELSEGKVVAVSSELSKFYKVDDIVLFPAKSGVGQILEGKAHLWIRNDEIWGVKNKAEAV